MLGGGGQSAFFCGELLKNVDHPLVGEAGKGQQGCGLSFRTLTAEREGALQHRVENVVEPLVASGRDQNAECLCLLRKGNGALP